MSGRPVYAPARTGAGTGIAVHFAQAVATRIDTAHISHQLTRMEGAVDSDPELVIGTAKEFVETTGSRRCRRERVSSPATRGWLSVPRRRSASSYGRRTRTWRSSFRWPPRPPAVDVASSR
jgi:hypothetical protein